MITVLKLKIAIWRKHPKALFALLRKILFARGSSTFLELLNFRMKTSQTDDGFNIVNELYGLSE